MQKFKDGVGLVILVFVAAIIGGITNGYFEWQQALNQAHEAALTQARNRCYSVRTRVSGKSTDYNTFYAETHVYAQRVETDQFCAAKFFGADDRVVAIHCDAMSVVDGGCGQLMFDNSYYSIPNGTTGMKAINPTEMKFKDTSDIMFNYRDSSNGRKDGR